MITPYLVSWCCALTVDEYEYGYEWMDKAKMYKIFNMNFYLINVIIIIASIRATVIGNNKIIDGESHKMFFCLLEQSKKIYKS